MKKNVLLIIGLFILLGSTAYAGTQDNMGLSAMWATISSWVSDGFLTKILGLMFFAVGVQRAFAGQILQFFMMLGLSLLVVNATTIMNTMFTAVI